MLFAQEKQRLLELVINHNVKPKEFVAFAKSQMVAAPDPLLEKWRDNFYRISPVGFTRNPRLINRFCVGADPEFAFFSGGSYLNSASFGLNTLEAFGSDMTGRQAELRAYPSRSVLEVVASVLDSLRHMSVACPGTLKASWMAWAFVGADGCGGHVHIGRKMPDKKETIPSLDALSSLLIKTNIVDKETSIARKEMTKYGKDSDFRKQPHGFEYRTMPTWLDSPWSAFLALTLSKLCILHKLTDVKSPKSTQTIENLLRAYANVDDDANLALQCFLRIGLPSCVRDDFKSRWGIPPTPVAKMNEMPRDRFFYPPIITPSVLTCKELFDHLSKGSPLGFTLPDPTWSPYKLDKDIHKLCVTAHYAGLPEVAMGLLSKGVPFQLLTNKGEKRGMVISHPPTLTLDANAIRQAALKFELSVTCKVSNNPYVNIYIPGAVAHEYVVDGDMVSSCRALLTKFGLFPIAKYEEIDRIRMGDFFGVKKNEPQLLGALVKEMYGSVVDPLKVEFKQPAYNFGGAAKLKKLYYQGGGVVQFFDEVGNITANPGLAGALPQQYQGAEPTPQPVFDEDNDPDW